MPMGKKKGGQGKRGVFFWMEISSCEEKEGDRYEGKSSENVAGLIDRGKDRAGGAGWFRKSWAWKGEGERLEEKPW